MENQGEDEMATQSITIAKATDELVFDTFSALPKKFSGSGVFFNLIGIDRPINLNDEKEQKILSAALAKKSFLIRHAQMNAPGLRIEFVRGTRRASEQPSAALFDQLEIESRNEQNRPPEVAVLDALYTLTTAFKPIQEELAVAGATEEQAKLQALHNSILQRLELAATTQTEQLNAFMRQKLSEFETTRKALEDEFAGKQDALRQEIENKKQELAARSADLEAKQKLLDDRDNTHVRRSIRQDLNKILNERLAKLSVSTRSLMREIPIHLVFCAVSAAAGYLASSYASALAELISRRPDGISIQDALSSSGFLSLMAKQTLSSVTLIASIVYYVRWLIRQHHDFVQTENDLRRYQVDFERASWVVETALEWRRDQSTQIPDSLLTAISRQLFAGEQKKLVEDLSPADMLASALLGSASKVSLNAGPAQFEWNGRKLAKAEMPDSR
jgi:hypothetical protein